MLDSYFTTVFEDCEEAYKGVRDYTWCWDILLVKATLFGKGRGMFPMWLPQSITLFNDPIKNHVVELLVSNIILVPDIHSLISSCSVALKVEIF